MLLSCGCRKSQDVFSELCLTLSMPDGAEMLSMSVDMSQKGNFFRNLNNLQEYEFPLFVAGEGRMRVQKGMYILAFDAKARMADGSERKVRCAAHASPSHAVSVLKASETLELELIIIK